MAILGLAYLGVYAWQVATEGDTQLGLALEAVSWCIWVLFGCDVVIRWVGSNSLANFLKTSWLEVIALVIPFIRFLRVFRIIVAIRGLRPFLKTRRQTTATYIALLLPLAWFSGAVAVLDAEGNSIDASIRNLPDALWWSLTTITTVGYGDLFPKTLEGKFIAATLMLTGIVLFSAGAGIFASWIIGTAKEGE